MIAWSTAYEDLAILTANENVNEVAKNCAVERKLFRKLLKRFLLSSANLKKENAITLSEKIYCLMKKLSRLQRRFSNDMRMQKPLVSSTELFQGHLVFLCTLFGIPVF